MVRSKKQGKKHARTEVRRIGTQLYRPPAKKPAPKKETPSVTQTALIPDEHIIGGDAPAQTAISDIGRKPKEVWLAELAQRIAVLEGSSLQDREELDNGYRFDTSRQHAADTIDTGVISKAAERNHNNQLLREYRRVQSRIRDGLVLYGICESCEEPIPTKRINSCFTTKCITCKEIEEKGGIRKSA